MSKLGRSVLVWMCTTVLVLAAAMALVAPASAQTYRGTILGTVTDSSGAVVPGAKVRVTNEGTGLTRETQTSEDGSYAVPELPIGSYSVTVEKEGFQTSVTKGVRVDVAVERRVDATLQAGDVNQRVEVAGETLAQVETTSNVLGGSFTAQEILTLPVNGRDYQKLLFLTPGAAGDPSGGMDSPGSFGLVSVNGNRGRSNNFLLDGTDMNDGYRSLPAINQGGVFGTPGTVLPVESIAEVRVLSNWEAEYGRNAGSVVNIVTKSGTNQFHGSVFEYFRNKSLNARNYFNDKPNPKDDFSNHQFGVALGGPLKKDKTFWYFNYEAQREKLGVTSINSVPTLADFDAALNLISGNTSTPCTGTIISCVTANSSFVNPVILNLFNLCNSNGGCSGDTDVWPAGAVSSAPAKNDADSFIFKLDHSINPNHNVTGRYFRGTSDQSFPLGLAGGNNLPNTNTDSPIKAQLLSLSYISIWGPSVVNEARFGWNLYEQDFLAQDRKVFGNPNSSIALNNGVSDPRDFGLPTIRVSGFAALGSAPYSNPRGRDDTSWHFLDGVSVKRNRHNWKFGYEFRRTAADSFYNSLFRGQLNFNGCVDWDPAMTGIFDPLADFLSGEICGGRIERGNTFRQTAQNSHAVYMQDSWRLTDNFTLNLGLRYDFYGVITEAGNRFSVYDPVAGLVIRPEVYDPDYNNLSPRASFAWDMRGNGKTVVRAGFGMFYDSFSQDYFVGQFPYNCFNCPGVGLNPTGPDPVLLSLSPILTLAPGASVFPTAGDSFDVNTINKLDTPYVYNFNLNIQQQLGAKTVFQVAYVGSAGHKLFRIRDINQPNQAAIDAVDPVNGCCVPRPFDTMAILDPVNAPFTPFYVNQLETSSNSNYHSLQVSLMQRNWGGLTQQIHYRWSHSIDDASDGQDFVPNASMPQDSTNPSGNRGNSNFDVRHSLIWTATYDFPKWEALGWFGSGWQISGVLSLTSGHPFHLNYNFLDDYDGSGSFFGRPDVTSSASYNRGDPRQFLDLAAFTVPCTLQDRDVDGDTVVDTSDGSAIFCAPGSRHFGSLGRNSLLGPDFRNIDFSITKITSFGERVKLHLRADIFNFFNHPNFSNPWLPTFFADAAPNFINTATGQSLGVLPITSTVDVGLGNPILGGGGPRSVQLSVKLTW